MPFTRAIKHESKLRMAIAGLPGSGKSWTSLIVGTALAEGKPLALIDTEHGSASKYADDFVFDVLELSHFHPQNYINAIHEAEQAGYAVLIIDSLSHAWNGTGGALELVEATARRVATQRKKDPNTFNAWGDVTPLQNKLIDTILGSSLHIIATMRSKTEYLVEKDNDGKSVPRKVGMAPIQRADVEYEFDIYADMDASNTMIIQKSRCSVLNNQIFAKPDGSLAEIIQTWLAGEPLSEAALLQAEMRKCLREFYDLAPSTYARIANWEKLALSQSLGTTLLPSEYTDKHVEQMRAYVEQRRREKEAKQSRVRSSIPTSPVKHETPHETQATGSKAPTVSTGDARPESHPDLDSLIKQAKLQAQKLGLAKDAAEWANLLKTCKVQDIKSAADLAVIVEHMNAFEQEANAASPDASPETDATPQLATLQQIASIKKLCGLLGREVLETETMTEEKAGQTILELSSAYKEARQALPVR